MHNVAGNNRMFCLLLAVAFCLFVVQASAAQAAAPAKSTASPQAAEVKAGLGVEKLDLTGSADSFEIAPDTKVYAWARVRDVVADSKVTIAFKTGDKIAFSKDITIPSTPYRIYAFKTFRKGDAGDWTIVVTGQDGKEIGTTTFKITLKE